MATREDLSGRKYGEWTVLRYAGNKKYTCQCSCGKIKDVAAQSLRNGASTSCGHKSQEDLTGRHFGEWTVLRYAGDKSWECQCSCGVIKNVRTFHLINNQSTSCGHTNKRLNNLVGQHFGEWDVLEYLGNRYYRCRCSCGVIKDVMGYSLTSGKSKSCGHDTSLFKDETGNVYGELTVLKYLGEHKWECRCSCGKIVQVMGKYLRAGRTTSCGHIKLNDLTGKQFGYWTALRYAGSNRWRCRCKCGTERDVLTQALVNGTSKSCGCGGVNVRENYRQKMLEKYGDVSSTHINNPREQWQIDTISDKNKLVNYIQELTENEKRPSITDLTHKLNSSFSTVCKAIHRFELEDIVDIYGEVSFEEKELLDYIRSIYNDEVLENDRKIIKPYELDIVLPKLKIAIEFNGTYWHSYPIKEKNYHFNKTLMCARQGYRLIHIFEYEWLSNKELVKKYLLNILTDNKTVIYGKNTYVKEVGAEEAKAFIINNHIQGYAKADINLGCYKDGSLIGVMTFGRPRFNSNYEYELIRLVWNNTCRVVGGAEKLLKYFKDNYNPKSIITYCNASKFTGNVYTRLGFKLGQNTITEPGYVWVNSCGKVVKRYSSMKQKLVDAGLGEPEQTEDEIMQNLGYIKIYDSGNFVFTWNNQEE